MEQKLKTVSYLVIRILTIHFILIALKLNLIENSTAIFVQEYGYFASPKIQ